MATLLADNSRRSPRSTRSMVTNAARFCWGRRMTVPSANATSIHGLGRTAVTGSSRKPGEPLGTAGLATA